MAKTTKGDSRSGKWLFLSKVCPPDAPVHKLNELVDQMVRHEVSYRYLDESGKRHSNDLPEIFLRHGNVNRVWSVITLGDRAAQQIELRLPRSSKPAGKPEGDRPSELVETLIRVLDDLYKDPKFASLRQDDKLARINRHHLTLTRPASLRTLQEAERWRRKRKPL